MLTTKDDKVYKARLVARGFHEEQTQQSDAPTVNKISKRLMFTIAACRKREVKSLDITSAFYKLTKSIERSMSNHQLTLEEKE